MALSAPQPVAPGKLTPPSLHSGLVWRESLLDRLNSHPDRPLTLVTGPAGSGKSTLAAQWLLGAYRTSTRGPAPNSLPRADSSRGAIAWLKLDERDQDPLNFLHWVTTAINHVAPGLIAASTRLLRAPESPSLDDVVQSLLLELHDSTSAITLVLDDYHSITAGAVHDIVTYVNRNLPARCRLMILSRSDPPLHLPRLRAEGQMIELRADDLRFSEAETATLLARVTGRGPRGELAAMLRQESDGWITGLRLLALACGATPGRFNQARHQIDRYLAREAFNRQPLEIRRVLLAFAVPPQVCPDLGAALLGCSGERVYVEDLLERIERDNLFILPLDTVGQWYRFHRPFRALLLHRLNHTSDHGLNRQELQNRAAQWFAAAGMQEAPTPHTASGANEEPIHTPSAGERLANSAYGAEPPYARACGGSVLYVAENPSRPYHRDERSPTVASTASAALVAGHALTEAAPARYAPLTRRESQILALLALRWSDKEIAEELVIAPKTVRRHTSAIYAKLGVHCRREAVATARQLGLLPAT